MLIHQNCSTAIEATMLNVEPLSMEWFNTPSLRVQAATQISRPAASESDLIALVEAGLAKQLPRLDDAIAESRRKIISDLFTAVDGANSVRVASAILDTIAVAPGKRRAVKLPQPSLRGRAVALVRSALGHKASFALRRRFGSAEIERRRAGKAFAAEVVNNVLRRLDDAEAGGRRFCVQRVTGDTRRVARAVSGVSLQFMEAA